LVFVVVVEVGNLGSNQSFFEVSRVSEAEIGREEGSTLLTVGWFYLLCLEERLWC